MKLFYDNIRPGEPQTHMLVIGVGAYPYLDGGIEGQVNIEWASHDLGQLISPIRSARAFAEWAVNDFHNPDAPLGSIDLLLSEKLKESPGERLATMNEIHNACWNWLHRCNADKESIAIFYFCGHGLSVGGHRLLLARDFAAPNTVDTSNTLHLELMRKGAAGMFRTPHQYFFIDACSRFIGDKSSDAAQTVFDTSKWHGQRLGFVSLASQLGHMAFSDEIEQIGIFTKVLLAGLRGRAYVKMELSADLWVITSETLHVQLCKIYRHMQHKEQVPFVSTGPPSDKVLHVCKYPPPRVPLTISFVPQALEQFIPQALEQACLILTPLDNGTEPFKGNPSVPSAWESGQSHLIFETGSTSCVVTSLLSKPCCISARYQALGNLDAIALVWELQDVPSGSYKLSAKFRSGYQNIEGEMILVDPPGPCPRPRLLRLKWIPLPT